MQLLNYKVQLLDHSGKHCNIPPTVFYTSEVYSNLHDCREFIHWLSCQLSSPIHYRFIEFAQDGDFNYIHHYPIMSKPPTKCIYFPPEPLYLYNKRKRRMERNLKGLYYEY